MIAFFALAAPAVRGQQDATIHGLWVWKGPSILQTPASVEALRDFCRANKINEVYVSVSERGELMLPANMARLIQTLHQHNIRVEALLSSESADEGGKHLEKLLNEVRTIVLFNQEQPRNRFDGIHLDIEPQQRTENKGPGNLRFLTGLVQAYRAVRDIAEHARMTVNADIQNKLLKADAGQRTMLLSSLPRFTLMMYELSSPQDGDDTAKKIEKVRDASKRFLDMAYESIPSEHLGKMVIGLRTPDYGDQLPTMLQALDHAHGSNPRYAGWARHSYNDTLPKR
ncbi:MAG TPA: hypothetical protein VMP12_11345 [Candidatus Sulfotelmatobacter sp.]|nr:hypothetical protein [Candidatus Sulfotelmatobacter sp.]